MTDFVQQLSVWQEGSPTMSGGWKYRITGVAIVTGLQLLGLFQISMLNFAAFGREFEERVLNQSDKN